MDAEEVANACGVARPWTGQIHCKVSSVPGAVKEVAEEIED